MNDYGHQVIKTIMTTALNDWLENIITSDEYIDILLWVSAIRDEIYMAEYEASFETL